MYNNLKKAELIGVIEQMQSRINQLEMENLKLRGKVASNQPTQEQEDELEKEREKLEEDKEQFYDALEEHDSKLNDIEEMVRSIYVKLEGVVPAYSQLDTDLFWLRQRIETELGEMKADV